MIEYEFNLKVPSGLRHDTPIHRTVDFFSVANILTSNSLYIPLAERLKDSNEGIDAALDLYAVSSGPCAGITLFFRDIDEFKEYHERQKRSSYISCWTQIRESVAMWALYSLDSSSVRITTTIGQLVDALRSYCEKEHDPRGAVEQGGKNGQFINSARILSVKYLSILDLSARINRRRRAYDRADSKGLIKTPGKVEEWSRRDFARADQYKFAAFELKDASFSHEMEMRAVIEAVPYDAETLAIAKTEMYQKIDPSNLMNVVYDRATLRYARAILREERTKKQLTVSEALFLPVPQGFITQVSIDPRCDLHKHEYMTNFFRERGIPVIPSTCFGYAANMISAQPRRKLLNRESKLNP
jgi:hypothetical protein